MCKSILENLQGQACNQTAVFLFQALHMYVIWSSASFPLKRNGHPPYDAVIAAHS